MKTFGLCRQRSQPVPRRWATLSREGEKAHSITFGTMKK